MIAMGIRTAVVPPQEIFDLRWSVLRPGRPREAAVFPEDADDETYHVAAYAEDGALAACVTFFPDELPGEPGPAYRFRGMASAPGVRGQGYGAAVLQAGLTEAVTRGARRAWCNGRTSARGFYEHQGFTVIGDEFVLEPAGPHYRFAVGLTVPPAP
jgi:GNAT superfamily N-acetyltransferase